MKTANVVDVRPVRAPANLDPAYTQPARRERIDQLLQVYPETNAEETAEIVEFLRRGMHLDVGLIAARDEFRHKVAEIRAAHPEAFRASALHTLLFLLIILVPLILFATLPQLLGRS
jgi:hypothetical protein